MGHRTTIELDEDLKQAIDDHNETMHDLVHEGLRALLGQADLDSEYLLEARVEQLDEEIAHWKEQRATADEKIASKEQERKITVQKLESLREDANTYEDDLDNVLDEMVEDSKNVFEEHPLVKAVARDHEEDSTTVIEDLQVRASERDLNLNEDRFVERMAAEYGSVEAKGGAF